MAEHSRETPVHEQGALPPWADEILKAGDVELVHPVMITKVKVVARNAIVYVGAAAVGAALTFTGTVDWEGMGLFGPLIGAAVAGLLDLARGYFAKSQPQDIPRAAPVERE